MDLDIPGDHLSVIFMRQTGMDVTDEEQQAWLVDELDGVGQWIIDPWARLLRGRNGNSTEDALAISSAIDAIRLEAGST